MGTPAAENSKTATSGNGLVAAWAAAVGYARVPFKKYGNLACIPFAVGVAAVTSSFSCTFIAFCVAYWLAVCD